MATENQIVDSTPVDIIDELTLAAGTYHITNAGPLVFWAKAATSPDTDELIGHPLGNYQTVRLALAVADELWFWTKRGSATIVITED